MMAGQKATCSFSAKKLSGLRFRTMRPMGCMGKMFSGQVLVTSSGSKSNLQAEHHKRCNQCKNRSCWPQCCNPAAGNLTRVSDRNAIQLCWSSQTGEPEGRPPCSTRVCSKPIHFHSTDPPTHLSSSLGSMVWMDRVHSG
jgi:hypothetical protein